MNKLELIRQEMMHIRGLAECLYHDADAFLNAAACMEYVNPDAPEVAGYLLRAIEPVRSVMLEIAGSTGRIRGIVRGVDEAEEAEEAEEPEEEPKSEEVGKFPWTTPLWMLVFISLMLNSSGEKDSLCEKGPKCAASDGAAADAVKSDAGTSCLPGVGRRYVPLAQWVSAAGS